jgi:succinate dehydrogenase hydrophobic anchor subunit
MAFGGLLLIIFGIFTIYSTIIQKEVWYDNVPNIVFQFFGIVWLIVGIALLASG